MVGKNKEEDDFVNWLNSIELVAKDGTLITATLVDDNSDDPENDRDENDK